MSSKKLNAMRVKQLVAGKFWEAEYADLYAPDIVIDMPNAAPGIPQHMDAFDVKLYFKWLAATVSSWEADVEEFYGTPDPNVFWAVSFIRADVHWGGQDGRFESKRFARYELRDGKVFYIKEVTNPLKWLEAAGRELPLFRMDLHHPKVDAALTSGAEVPHSAGSEPLDMSAEAISDRIAGGLHAFMASDYWEATAKYARYAADATSAVWFLPPEMQESYPEELMARVETWSVLSCPTIDFDSRGFVWETDDPHIYFCEYACCGITDWLGNDTPNARYRNRYFYILRFNDAGEICRCEEILNPINKFNSINVSIPSFPYYF